MFLKARKLVPTYDCFDFAAGLREVTARDGRTDAASQVPSGTDRKENQGTKGDIRKAPC